MHFGQPVQQRDLFRFLIRTPVRSILEVGIGNCQRMKCIAKLVHTPAGVEEVRYIGTDEFEAAVESSGHVSLKQAHQIAGGLGFKASLIPGDVASAVPRVAHKMGASDLIIVDGGLDPQNPMASALGPWFNHLTHESTVVFGCRDKGDKLVKINLALTKQDASRAA